MNFLEERIVKDGIVKEGNVLKVDSFLNHQMDIALFNQMGAEFKHRFEGKQINKILTIEASGIGIACVVAQHFGVPVVFAKKAKSINIDGEMYTAEVESFTHKTKNQVIVSKKFLKEGDRVLIIDDFLANGCALQGLIQIVQAAGGQVEGILGLFAKYWTRLVTPVVAASVVTSIGFSLLSVGASSFGGGSGAEDFGSAQNLILGGITLVCCIAFNIFAKSYWKQRRSK